MFCHVFKRHFVIAAFCLTGHGLLGQGLGDLVNAKDFGAVPGFGGIPDSTRALQNAVDFVAKNHKRLWIPAGEYFISSPISIRAGSNFSIVGDGQATCVTVTADTSILEMTGVCSKIQIRDICFVSRLARSGGYGIYILGTPVTHSDTIAISNVLIQNAAFPFYARYLSNATIEGSKIIGSIPNAVKGSLMYFQDDVNMTVRDVTTGAYNGAFFAKDNFVIDSNCSAMVFDNLRAGGQTVSGWTSNSVGSGFVCRNSLGAAGHGPQTVRFNNCIVEQSLNGYLIQDGRDIQIDGGHAVQCNEFGYLIAGGVNVTITNSDCFDNLKHGFYIAGGKGISISNCTASNNSYGSHSAYDGCRIEDGVKDVRIIGNRFGDYIFTYPAALGQRYGLSIGVLTDEIIATGNSLGANQLAGLGNFSTGTHNSITGNIP
jgi:parallel beta-helix repeat protein